MLTPVSNWTDVIASLSPVADTSWAQSFAAKIASLVDQKLQIATITPPSLFTLNQSVFAAALLQAVPTDNKASGTLVFANAWAQAVLASTMIVTPGSAVGAPTPPTTWSVVASTIVLPPSVELAKTALALALSQAPEVSNPQESVFAKEFRKAFLSLQYTVTGLNSVPPPTGPQPLIFTGGTQ